jgi:hypothetical protein
MGFSVLFIDPLTETQKELNWVRVRLASLHEESGGLVNADGVVVKAIDRPLCLELFGGEGKALHRGASAALMRQKCDQKAFTTKMTCLAQGLGGLMIRLENNGQPA